MTALETRECFSLVWRARNGRKEFRTFPVVLLVVQYEWGPFQAPVSPPPRPSPSCCLADPFATSRPKQQRLGLFFWWIPSFLPSAAHRTIGGRRLARVGANLWRWNSNHQHTAHSVGLAGICPLFHQEVGIGYRKRQGWGVWLVWLVCIDWDPSRGLVLGQSPGGEWTLNFGAGARRGV